MAALKAGGLQTFFQAGLDAGQARYSSTDHSHLLNHSGEQAQLITEGTRYTGWNWNKKEGERENVCYVVL